MDEITNNTGANDVNIADSQVNNNVDTNSSSANNNPDGGSESLNSQSNENPIQDSKTNSAFAEMRRAKESTEKELTQIKRDFSYIQKYPDIDVSSEVELREKYSQYGITSWEDVDAYNEAQQMNIDPELYRRINEYENKTKEALEKLSKYERKDAILKESDKLANDPKWGSFFNENKEAIVNLAEQYNLDLQTAKLLVLEQKYENPNLEQIKQDAIKNYIEKVKNGNVPIEGSGNTAVVTGNEPPKTFEDAKKQALAYLKGVQKNKT